MHRQYLVAFHSSTATPAPLFACFTCQVQKIHEDHLPFRESHLAGASVKRKGSVGEHQPSTYHNIWPLPPITNEMFWWTLSGILFNVGRFQRFRQGNIKQPNHQKFQGLKNIASDHGSVLRLVPFTCFVFRFEMDEHNHS